MNTTQQGLVTLLKSAITGESIPLPEGFALEQAYSQVMRHQIVPLIFRGAVTCGIPKTNPVMQQLFRQSCMCLLNSENQLAELRRLYKAFDENGILYMPLKGCNMKDRYPKPELRVMGDADILIRMEQYQQIVPIMESLGFRFKLESDHELIWQSDGLYLELHKRLVPSYNRDLNPYFENCWEKAEIVQGSRYGMTPEDEWLYLFTHFAKHFRDSGIGCRHVVDLWVFLRTHPNLQEAPVKNALGELQLLEFYENILHLICAWFEDGVSDQKVDVLTEYIFSSGSWGSGEASVLSGILRNSTGSFRKHARLQYIWKYAFPNLETMQRRHKILKKMPFLLPVMWLIRLAYKVLLDRQDLKKRERDLSVITEENIQMRRALLNYVGLDYH